MPTARIPLGTGIAINAPAGPDHKMNVGATDSIYATKEAIPSYWRYDGMPVWAKEAGVWNKYILSADLTTWIPDIGGVSQAVFDAHVAAVNPHNITAANIQTIFGNQTVEAALIYLAGLAENAATQASLTAHTGNKSNPHEVNASQIPTTTLLASVQTLLDLLRTDVDLKATIQSLTTHAALKVHAGATAADLAATGTWATVQAAITGLQGLIQAIDTLSELTGSVASSNTTNLSFLKALNGTPYTYATANQTVLNLSGRSIFKSNYSQDKVITALNNPIDGGLYWLILGFTAACTVSFSDASVTGLDPIKGYAGTTCLLTGVYYDSKWHFTRSELFDLKFTYYYGASEDTTVLAAEILAQGTSAVSGKIQNIKVNYNMVATAYPWFAAPQSIPFTMVQEVLGDPMTIESRFTITTAIVNSVTCNVYVHKTYPTQVSTLTFIL
jgi:hypothetical protein